MSERTTIANFKNGNYHVMLLSDGTKIRYGKDGEEFDAEFPESIDLNITDWCDLECPYCYRGCTKNGKHFRFDEKYLDSLDFKPGMEIAIGGGSPIKHPDLDKFCEYFTKRGCIPNITVHWSSTAIVEDGNLRHLQRLQSDGLLHGIGVSVPFYSATVMQAMKFYLKNTVAHVIAGLIDTNAVYQWYKTGIPVLVLGYKDMGRGKINSPEDGIEIWNEIYLLKEMISGIVSGSGLPDFESSYGPVPDDVKPIISFDNLALRQLGLQEMLSAEAYCDMYMGDDGVDGTLTSASMYMDLVAGTYARNSTGAPLHDISGKTVSECFKNAKNFG